MEAIFLYENPGPSQRCPSAYKTYQLVSHLRLLYILRMLRSMHLTSQRLAHRGNNHSIGECSMLLRKVNSSDITMKQYQCCYVASLQPLASHTHYQKTVIYHDQRSIRTAIFRTQLQQQPAIVMLAAQPVAVYICVQHVRLTVNCPLFVVRLGEVLKGASVGTPATGPPTQNKKYSKRCAIARSGASAGIYESLFTHQS